MTDQVLRRPLAAGHLPPVLELLRGGGGAEQDQVQGLPGGQVRAKYQPVSLALCSSSFSEL